MNTLLLWMAIGVFLSSCTNWPREGYFDNTKLHTDERIQFKQHYDYLNLHFSVANLRGAQTCTPAYVKAVEKINSRVEKAIAVEDPQDIKIEIAILEKKITDLIVYLNRVTSNTHCAQPPRLFTSTFVHPLTYQLDLLLYCAPQFEAGSAILTAQYKVCLRQVGFLLLDNPEIMIEYTKYNLFEHATSPQDAESTISYSNTIVTHHVDTIVTHNIDAIVDNTNQQSGMADKEEEEEEDENYNYNDVMRQYLIFDQVPSVSVQQLSRLQLNIEQDHTPVQIHEIQPSNRKDNAPKYAVEGNDATSLEDVALLNLRTDVIFSYVSDLIANTKQNKIIYEALSLDVIPALTPVISTLMWQTKSNKDVDHKVKNWRFLLPEGALFSDAALPKGVTL